MILTAFTLVSRPAVWNVLATIPGNVSNSPLGLKVVLRELNSLLFDIVADLGLEWRSSMSVSGDAEGSLTFAVEVRGEVTDVSRTALANAVKTVVPQADTSFVLLSPSRS